MLVLCTSVTIAFVAALNISTPASAADFTIQNGQTVAGQTLTTPGDVGTIDAGGTINTAVDGVIGTVNNLTVINNGTIISTNRDGIDIDGANGVIINNGTITADDDGIEVRDGHTITNNGTITATTDDGIEGDDGNTITNTGTITAIGNGGNDDGIRVNDNNVINNSGTITAFDDGIEVDDNNTLINSGLISSNTGEAIRVDDDNRIENSGTIRNTGTNDAIDLDHRNIVINSGLITSTTRDGIDGGDDNTVINSGIIRGANGPGDNGIDLQRRSLVVNSGLVEGREGVELNQGSGPNGSTIINSGTIRSLNGPTGIAIRYRGNRPDTLTLLPGSIVEGRILLGAGTDTLNVGNGLNLASTFEGGPEIINTNGAPFARLGGLVVVVDPTALAMYDETLIDLTNGIFSTIHNRLGAGAEGGPLSGPVNFDAPMALGFGTSLKDDGPAANSGSNGWGQVFGAVREQNGQSPTVDAGHWLAGLVVGMDGNVSGFETAGAFIGTSTGEIDVDFNAQEVDIDSYFGGFYGSQNWAGIKVDMMLTGGVSDYESRRQVANNLVVGGIEFASADFDSYFISPEIAFSAPATIMGQTIVSSVRLRYAGLFIDGATETGSAGNLTTNDRDIHMLQGRAQIAFPNLVPSVSGVAGSFVPYLAVEGRTTLSGDDVGAVLLGQTINFDPGGDDEVADAIAGATFSQDIGGGMTFFGGFEGRVGSDESSGAQGQLGVRVRF